MPANEYYDSTGAPSTGSDGDSSVIRTEFDLIQDGFNKLPVLAGNGSLPIFVNAGGVGLEAVSPSIAANRIGCELVDHKDASDGYPGLTLFKINFNNAANTFVSYLTNNNTASRTYIFPDKSGTVAMTDDLPEDLSATISGVQADISAIQSDVSSLDGIVSTIGSDVSTLASTVSDLPIVPVGSIIPWIGGYFTNSSNGGFTSVLGNTVAAVNALLNSYGFYVCDGSALNIPGSPIFDGPGRYLPNLTDDRFLMGDIEAGAIGGSSTMPHTHTGGSHTLTTAEIPAHSHGQTTYGGGSVSIGVNSKPNSSYQDGTIFGTGGGSSTTSSGLGGAHNHGTTSGASNAENRPNFLACFLLMRAA